MDDNDSDTNLARICESNKRFYKRVNVRDEQRNKKEHASRENSKIVFFVGQLN